MFHLKNRLPEQRPILTDASIDLVHTPVGPAFGESYGLGWVIHTSDRGHRLIEHSGGMPGVNTILNLYPDQNVVVTVLTNGSLGWGAVADEAAAAVLPGYADSLKVERAKPRPRPTPAKFVPTPALVGTWTGTLRSWAKTLPFELEIRADGEIQAQLGAGVAPNADNEGRQLRALVNEASLTDGVLSGRFAGEIPTPDVSWVAHTIGFDLHLVNGVLRGQASAQTPVRALFFSVASYLELRKK